MLLLRDSVCLYWSFVFIFLSFWFFRYFLSSLTWIILVIICLYTSFTSFFTVSSLHFSCFHFVDNLPLTRMFFLFHWFIFLRSFILLPLNSLFSLLFTSKILFYYIFLPISHACLPFFWFFFFYCNNHPLFSTHSSLTLQFSSLWPQGNALSKMKEKHLTIQTRLV